MPPKKPTEDAPQPPVKICIVCGRRWSEPYEDNCRVCGGELK